MSKKKAPASTGARKESKQNKFNSQQRHYTGRGKECKIELYPEGVRLTAPSSGFKGQPDHLKGVRRGEVKGFSHASRKAMREWFLTHRVKDNHHSFAVTLTVPGPPLKKEEWEKLWNVFGVYLRRQGGGAPWRKEVQSRDAVHWHCLLVLPYCPKVLESLNHALPVYPELDSILKVGRQVGRFYSEDQQMRDALKLYHSGAAANALIIHELWLRSLNTLGPITHRYKSGEIDRVPSRSLLVGADRYASEIVLMDDTKKGWNRYMLDHTTKSKQEQIAEHKGRQWGVINRKLFVKLDPAESNNMTWKEYSRFLRAYNRLITPYVRHDGALFGKVKGRSFRRGMYGKYVSFSNPDTIQRLIDWAKKEVSYEGK